MIPPTQQNEPDPGTATAGAINWEENVYPVEGVRELLNTFTKTLRAFQLYDENNPVYQRFVGNLVNAFGRIWEEVDRVPLAIQEDQITYHGQEVYREASRSESLAFLMYKDGVREMVFLPGLEEGEIEVLLQVLQQARHLREEEDDLLTLLWTADLEFFRYTYVDLLGEGVQMPEAGEGAGPEKLEAVVEEEMGERVAREPGQEAAEETERPPGQVSQEDFNPALYSLDPTELEQLQREVEREMARDVRGDVLSALFDRLEDPGTDERKREILSVFRGMLPGLLSRGALDEVGAVLDELRAVRHQEGVLSEEIDGEIDALLEEVSSSGSIRELVRALEDGTVRPSAVELAGFLRHLRAGALAPLLRALELTEVKELKPILREAVQGIADGNKEEVTALLQAEDPVVLAGATRLVGDMEVGDAAGAVAELFKHRSPHVRLAAVEAARSLRAPSTTGGLPAVLRDSDRDVRIAAARALGHLGYAPAASRLRALVESKEIRNADITEKIAVFESYGQLGDHNAVKILSGLLNGRGFLGRKEPSDIRAAAALGLGKMGTDEALAALREAQNEEDPVIRSAVNRALRGGRD